MSVQGWDIQAGDAPLPPQNAMAFATMGLPGAVDLRWDDPSLIALNSRFNIAGVNIYRSDVSDRGPYYGPINEFPIGGGFYRDQTTIQLVDHETVGINSWRARGDEPNNAAWILCTQYPIVKLNHSSPFGQTVFGNAPSDVQVWIDGVEVGVHEVFGRTGEIRLVNQDYYNLATQRTESALLPSDNSTVEVSYYREVNLVRSGLDFRTFYRVVTVAIGDGEYIESPLAFTKPVNNLNIEQMDYIWKEAIRRNHWILQQGGERVKLFIRRTSGILCNCQIDARELEYRQQPVNSCTTCYGTGWVGGYEGPYDILIVQDNAENRIAQMEKGRKKEKTLDVWMTMTPLVTQRDFIVKLTGERFSVGPVTRQTVRGMILQQHYNIGYLDEGDIRYQIPIDGVADLIRTPQTRYSQVPEPRQPVDGDTSYQGQDVLPVEAPFPVGNEERWPEVTDKDTAVIPADRQQRGRTPVWENGMY